jgi:hypothetical protein
VGLSAFGAVLLLAGGAFLAVDLAGGGGTPGPRTSGSTGGTATASAPVTPFPEPTRAITLPGIGTVARERDDDPIKVTSYSFNQGRDVYVRDGDTFARTTKYFEVGFEDGRRRLLGTDTKYTTSGYATVSLVDNGTGKSTRIVTVKAPQYVSFPTWSPDGSKALLTVLKSVGGKASGQGFGIVDAATGKWTFVPVTATEIGDWSYFWRGDGQAVGTWAVSGDTAEIRFYNLDGSLHRTLTGVGSPLDISSYDVSPSGDRFLTLCAKKSPEVCVWTTDGRAAGRIPFRTEQLIGWYDDRHVAGWRKMGDGYEAVVFDLGGAVVRRLATASAKAYRESYLHYTRER